MLRAAVAATDVQKKTLRMIRLKTNKKMMARKRLMQKRENE